MFRDYLINDSSLFVPDFTKIMNYITSQKNNSILKLPLPLNYPWIHALGLLQPTLEQSVKGDILGYS